MNVQYCIEAQGNLAKIQERTGGSIEDWNRNVVLPQ